MPGDTQLKESAQRAFQSYLKSVYLLKNKHVFDVFKLDTAAFASSLGLAVPPRVRFLERQIKNKSSNKTGLTAAGAAREAAANKKTRLVSDSEGKSLTSVHENHKKEIHEMTRYNFLYRI